MEAAEWFTGQQCPGDQMSARQGQEQWYVLTRTGTHVEAKCHATPDVASVVTCSEWNRHLRRQNATPHPSPSRCENHYGRGMSVSSLICVASTPPPMGVVKGIITF